MKKSSKKMKSHCPINFGLNSFGDKWALLILRDIIFRGKETFGDFLKSEEGFATNILTSRLDNFIDNGILEKQTAPEDARKDIYKMTQKGLDLIPMIFEIILWSAKYDKNSEAHRIPGLVDLIRKNNRSISEKSMVKVRQGQGIVFDYLLR